MCLSTIYKCVCMNYVQVCLSDSSFSRGFLCRPWCVCARAFSQFLYIFIQTHPHIYPCVFVHICHICIDRADFRICMCMYICMYIYGYTCVSMCIYEYVCLCIYLLMYIYEYVQIHKKKHMHICMCVYIHVYLYMYMYICIIFIYIHRYVHVFYTDGSTPMVVRRVSMSMSLSLSVFLSVSVSVSSVFICVCVYVVDVMTQSQRKRNTPKRRKSYRTLQNLARRTQVTQQNESCHSYK